ncbi:MAG: carbohydrate ABC transporter permease [Anaerolineae bacterium]|nr:carbohydrate ABC transporter permease [Anaerolineae bacterium]
MSEQLSHDLKLSRTKRRKLAGRIVAWVFLSAWLLITLLPLWWIVRMAFSTQRELLANPSSFLPVNFTWDAFKRVLGTIPVSEAIAQGGYSRTLHFWLYLRNTFIVTAATVLGGIVFNAMAAYAFARLKFPGRDKIFNIYILALIMPTVLNLIPNFILIHQLGWVGTLQGIIAPTFLGSAFGVFFLRQFFLGLNRDLEDAARIDGAGIIGVFWHVALPISLPPLLTISILTFIDTWNNFQWPYFAGGMGTQENATVLTVALAVFRAQQQTGLPDYTGMMAGTLISLIPTILIFLFVGRNAVDSIQFSGIK